MCACDLNDTRYNYCFYVNVMIGFKIGVMVDDNKIQLMPNLINNIHFSR